MVPRLTECAKKVSTAPQVKAHVGHRRPEVCPCQGLFGAFLKKHRATAPPIAPPPNVTALPFSDSTVPFPLSPFPCTLRCLRPREHSPVREMRRRRADLRGLVDVSRGPLLDLLPGISKVSIARCDYQIFSFASSLSPARALRYLGGVANQRSPSTGIGRTAECCRRRVKTDPQTATEN